jgi:hypothetical protein
MAIITQNFDDEKCRSKSILQFAKDFNIGKILANSNIRKATGVGVLTVFVHLLSVCFSGKSLNQLLQSKDLNGKKDVFYRFMNSISANWYKFINLLSAVVITYSLKLANSQTQNQMSVLILDDTLHKRDRSKNVELLVWVKDHNDGRNYRGFRCLTMGFHNGDTFIPVDFRILSSQKEDVRINDMRPDLDKRTIGYKIRQDALSNTYQLAFKMIQNQTTPARHVLFDCWFSEPVMFKTLRKLDLHGIGMLKARSGSFYRFKGKMYSLETLYHHVKHLIPTEHKFVSIGVEFADGTPFSITFVNDKRNKKDWLAIGTTDLSLSRRQVFSLYSRRWNIEVFFKTVKSYLGFAKECQSRSFDAVVCSVAVVFTRYIMLAWQNQGLPIPETDGQLFFRLCEEMRKCTFAEALEFVFLELNRSFVHFDNMLFLALKDFFSCLPSCINPLHTIRCCET